MAVKNILISSLTLVSLSVLANPAPVTEISRSRTVAAAQSGSVVATGTVEQRIATLERVVEARAEAQIRMQQQLQLLLDEVSELRGVTETHSYQLEEILQRQRDLYQEIDRRVSAVQGASANAPASAAPEKSIPVISYSSDVSENDAYDKAVNMVLKERRYDAAIPEFESFIKQYPDSAYTPNAHYWLGQLLFNNGDHAKAKTHFERVVTNFPDSNKVSDALLKLGQIAERENSKDAAIRFYRRVVSEHPNATSAKLAQERLDSLK
ncbi:tol-pal system protein YbgF [Chromatiaceae bacterium AAb-1]|nr:tol-pal system protein YbgF [Chromatiaceae bacterium AAb-1]